eukprot:3941185-Rhodomonas_salina.4
MMTHGNRGHGPVGRLPKQVGGALLAGFSELSPLTMTGRSTKDCIFQPRKQKLEKPQGISPPHTAVGIIGPSSKGQMRGMRMQQDTIWMIWSGSPILVKSRTLYPPGPHTICHPA